MSDELANQLEVIHHACTALLSRSSGQDTDLNCVLTALDRLILERTAMPALRATMPGRTSVADEVMYWTVFERQLTERAARRAPSACGAADSPIDTQALASYLGHALPSEAGVRVKRTHVASAGHSKQTILVALEGQRTLPEEIALRMDRAYSFFGTAVHEEYPVVARLFELGIPVPRPYALEATGHVLGGPFIVFARVFGKTIGSNYLPPPRNEALEAHMAATLAQIHAVSAESVRPVLTRGIGARPYLEQELETFEGWWRDAGLELPLIDVGFKWIKKHWSVAHGQLGLVHNDYNYHNCLVDEERVKAVLDWEFVHLGNPVSDLGYHSAVAYPDGGFERFLEHYVAAGGARPDPKTLDFYTLWGHLRMAVLCVQADLGFRGGKTHDIRHGLSWPIYLPKSLIGLGKTLTRLA